MKIKSKGLTLIEVMISLFIFAVLILGTSQVMIHSILVQNRCQNRLTSLELAVNKIETFKSLNFDHPELKKGSREDEITQGKNQKKFYLNTNIQEISPDIKRIIVGCSSQKKQAGKVTLAVYISRKMGF